MVKLTIVCSKSTYSRLINRTHNNIEYPVIRLREIAFNRTRKGGGEAGGGVRKILHTQRGRRSSVKIVGPGEGL